MRLILLFVILCAIIFSGVGSSINEPAWPDRFRVEFQEHRWPTAVGTNGSFYYDFTQKRLRVDRENSASDPVCFSTRDSKLLKITACTQLLVKDVLYVLHEGQSCCQCCTARQGCSIPAPGWLKNAERTKVTALKAEDGRVFQVEHWRSLGLPEPIFYSQTEERKQPVALVQPGSLMKFDPQTFKEGQWSQDMSVLTRTILLQQEAGGGESSASALSLFDLPRDCQEASACPTSSLCGLVAKRPYRQNSFPARINAVTVVSSVLAERDPTLMRSEEILERHIDGVPSAGEAARFGSSKKKFGATLRGVAARMAEVTASLMSYPKVTSVFE